jgi:hypothetical protein
MGYWANTTYVNHANPGEFADALAAVCRAEGMELVAAPPQRRGRREFASGAGRAEDKARVIAQKFGGRNAAFCDNLVSVDTLISHKPFTVPSGVVLYLKWPGRNRQRFSACASWEQYRAALRGER